MDETTWLTATKDHPTIFATGLVDLTAKVVIDVIPGRSAAALGSWLDRKPREWRERIDVVATDLAESCRSGLAGRLDHATRSPTPSTW